MAESVRKVDSAMLRVMELLAREGVAKGRKADAGGSRYNYRGIDDVYRVLGACLIEAKLTIKGRMVSKEVTERTTKSGGNATCVHLVMEYKFTSAEDGSHDIATYPGEAFDNSDKATKKALSAAYSYMAFQTFAIPLAGEDSEQDHIEVKARGVL